MIFFNPANPPHSLARLNTRSSRSTGLTAVVAGAAFAGADRGMPFGLPRRFLPADGAALGAFFNA